MAKIRPRKVKVIRENSRTVVLLFLEQNCKVELPKTVFNRRWEMGFYEVLNPAAIAPAF